MKLKSKLSLTDQPSSALNEISDVNSPELPFSAAIEMEPQLRHVCCCPLNKNVKEGCIHDIPESATESKKWKNIMLKVQSRKRDNKNKMNYCISAQNMISGEKRPMMMETHIIDGPDLPAIENILKEVVDLASSNVQILIVISEKMLAKKAAKSAKALTKH